MIKLTEWGPTIIPMELDMRANGLRICSMVKVKKFGLMVLVLPVNIKWGRNKEKVVSCGLMELCMMETSTTII